jgi:hypothetical protein
MHCAALLFIYGPLTFLSKHKKTWAIVFMVTLSEFIAWQFYGNNDIELYVIRTTAALIGGLALCRVGGKLALWQAMVYLMTLFSYCALAFDVMANKHILIYNNFEAVIYGLVACQLAGICCPLAPAFIHTSYRVKAWVGCFRKNEGVTQK